jgi:hypothetical protein
MFRSFHLFLGGQTNFVNIVTDEVTIYKTYEFICFNSTLNILSRLCILHDIQFTITQYKNMKPRYFF